MRRMEDGMSEKTQNTKELAVEVLKAEGMLEGIVAALAGPSRRVRQNASSVLAQVAKIDPEKLAPHADEFIDALNRPEAQTRWESLDVLTELVSIDSRACDFRLLIPMRTGNEEQQGGQSHYLHRRVQLQRQQEPYRKLESR